MILEKKETVAKILSSPNAVRIANELAEKLEEERQRRNLFYNEISEYEKAEFIDGEIIIHSLVKKGYNDASGNLYQLIDAFVKVNKSGYVGYEKIMISLSRNDYVPDICFFGNEKAQHFKKGQSLFPAPDLTIEILSESTQKNDRGVKFHDYQAHGVLEYWMVDPINELVEQYRLNEKGAYELILKTKQGRIECKVLPAFELDVAAIFDEDKNLAALRKIITSA